jgi:hypothetical protein
VEKKEGRFFLFHSMLPSTRQLSLVWWPLLVTFGGLSLLVIGLGTGLGIGYTNQPIPTTFPRTPAPTPEPASELVYNSNPLTYIPSEPSEGAEANSLYQFGDQVVLAGTNRLLNKAVATLVTQSLHSNFPGVGNASGWVEPISLNLYEVGPSSPYGYPTVGSEIGSVTQDFLIPWRPEATVPNCTGNRWLANNSHCYSGLAFQITFTLPLLAVPDNLVWGLSFSTEHYGPAPYNVTGPYDSLNFAVFGNATTGSQFNPEAAWGNSTAAYFYCDNYLGLGIFRPDENCTGMGFSLPILCDIPGLNTTCVGAGDTWAGYAPQIAFYAVHQ